MKEAIVAIRESYKKELLSYLRETVRYCERTKKEDEQFIVESLCEILDNTPVVDRLKFDHTKLGY